MTHQNLAKKIFNLANKIDLVLCGHPHQQQSTTAHQSTMNCHQQQLVLCHKFHSRSHPYYVFTPSHHQQFSTSSRVFSPILILRSQLRWLHEITKNQILRPYFYDDRLTTPPQSKLILETEPSTRNFILLRVRTHKLNSMSSNN